LITRPEAFELFAWQIFLRINAYGDSAGDVVSHVVRTFNDDGCRISERLLGQPRIPTCRPA